MPMMSDAVVPGWTLRPARWSQAMVASKLVTNPWLVATGGTGAVPLPNSWELVLAYPSPGSAPGMKYAPGSVGLILYTVTGLPLVSGLDSVPVRPSKAAPAGDTLPESAYRNPSM